MKILDEKNVCTDHSAVKQGCKIEEKGKEIPVFKILAADHISSHGQTKQTNDRSYNCN